MSVISTHIIQYPASSIQKSRLVMVVLLLVCFSLVPGSTIAQTTLKDAFNEHFMMGAALNGRQYTKQDQLGAGLAAREFNTVTPENVMKWFSIHPEDGRYAFEGPDQFVAFGEENNQFVVGHTLVWHSQTPGWVFEDGNGNPATREILLERMRDHIHTIVGRYKGRVDGWDVVNEALNEDGTLRESPWYNIIGEDYIAKAFQFAHEADPDAELYYNDYSLPNPAKRDGAIRIVERLQEQGVPIHGVGMQGHYGLGHPTLENLDAAITKFSELGVKVMITELDVDVLPAAVQGADISQNMELRDELNPYTEGFPDEMEQQLADRYAEFFNIFLKHRQSISRVTFWGVTDGDSWKNNWPIRGRTNYPLVFDREGQPKPAYHAIVKLAGEVGQ